MSIIMMAFIAGVITALLHRIRKENHRRHFFVVQIISYSLGIDQTRGEHQALSACHPKIVQLT